ncbi:MAG: DNA-binding response regulator [Gemmatimonadetes bacterium]|jgi:DNA-binding response OmpR family regulator|nr:DNA-binding response regulator [Gemmatimonadota bacterium]
MTLIEDRPSATESAPGSHVVLVTGSGPFAEQVRVALRDPDTSVAEFDAMAALEALEAAPDLIILDASAPQFVEPRPLGRLRHRWPSVLIVAVRVADEHVATTLLEAGADDAIEARHDWAHVAARLNASARRIRMANALLRRRVGDVVYDRDNRRVWCAGIEVEFAPRELAVLDALWIRAGELVRHESLQDYVWSGVEEGERSNRLEVYISYIRRKLRRSNEVTIQTLRGAGYRLVRKSATDTPWERDET